jgi:DNA uptake protein ComE-like DNA-binding protein
MMRQDRGGFRSVYELKEVKGIGEARLRAIGGFIEVKGTTDF